MTARLTVSIILVSCAAYSGLFAMPLWIGGLTDALEVSSAVPGYLGSVQLACAALASLWTSMRIGSISLRRISWLGVTLILLANVACSVLSRIEPLFVARAVSGVGEGLLLACLNATISRTDRPDRYVALSQTAIAVFGIVLFAVAPRAVSALGVAAVFALVAAVATLAAFGVAAFPVERTPADTRRTLQWSGLNLAVLAALGAVFVGCQGAWAYMERLGIAKQLTIEDVSRYLTIGQVLGLLGPVAANWFVRRGGLRKAIMAGLAISALSALAASQPGPQEMYALAAATYQFGTLFIVTSYLSYLVRVDGTGRNAAAAPAAISVGSALGPASMAIGISLAGYPAIGWLVVAVYAAAIVIILADGRAEARAAP